MNVPKGISTLDDHIEELLAQIKPVAAPGSSRDSIHRHLLTGGLIVLLLAFGVGGWAATTQIAGALIAQGSVVVDSNVKKVQHPTGGVVGKLNVQDGDHVKAGDILADIETDKATMEMEAVDEGTFAKILVPEGTENVAVNLPIALIAGEGEDAAGVAKAAPEASAPRSPKRRCACGWRRRSKAAATRVASPCSTSRRSNSRYSRSLMISAGSDEAFMRAAQRLQ